MQLLGVITPCIQCTLINFIATEKGLEDQLLAKVVGVERPELEKQAQELQSAFNQVNLAHQFCDTKVAQSASLVRLALEKAII